MSPPDRRACGRAPRRRRRSAPRARSRNAWRAVRAASSIERLLARGSRRHVLAVRQPREAEAAASHRCKALVLVGRGAKLMIEMRHADDLQVTRFRERLQERRRAPPNRIHPRRRRPPGSRRARSCRRIVCRTRASRSIGMAGGPGRRAGRYVRSARDASCLLPFPPDLPEIGAGGRIRTVDPALMRRVLSPTELLRRTDNSSTIRVWRSRIRVDDGGGEQRNHDLVVADERVAAARARRWAG